MLHRQDQEREEGGKIILFRPARQNNNLWPCAAKYSSAPGGRNPRYACRYVFDLAELIDKEYFNYPY